MALLLWEDQLLINAVTGNVKSRKIATLNINCVTTEA